MNKDIRKETLFLQNQILTWSTELKTRRYLYHYVYCAMFYLLVSLKSLAIIILTVKVSYSDKLTALPIGKYQI